MATKKFVAPALSTPPVEYDFRREDQLIYQLRLYFNLLDNFLAAVAASVTDDGYVFPDGTLQTTAWEPSYVEAYDRSASIAINNTPTLLKPANYIPATAQGITYDPATGEFTFEYEGVYSLAITLNITASSANQYVYLYAQKDVGAGWVNTANSGKAYELKNGLTVQFTTPQSVYRAAGEKTRYYIYSNGTTSSLVTNTLPGVSPTVYVPAIRIQYAGG
jgi:hypothetical protein